MPSNRGLHIIVQSAVFCCNLFKFLKHILVRVCHAKPKLLPNISYMKCPKRKSTFIIVSYLPPTPFATENETAALALFWSAESQHRYIAEQFSAIHSTKYDLIILREGASHSQANFNARNVLRETAKRSSSNLDCSSVPNLVTHLPFSLYRIYRQRAERKTETPGVRRRRCRRTRMLTRVLMKCR